MTSGSSKFSKGTLCICFSTNWTASSSCLWLRIVKYLQDLPGECIVSTRENIEKERPWTPELSVRPKDQILRFSSGFVRSLAKTARSKPALQICTSYREEGRCHSIIKSMRTAQQAVLWLQCQHAKSIFPNKHGYTRLTQRGACGAPT